MVDSSLLDDATRYLSPTRPVGAHGALGIDAAGRHGWVGVLIDDDGYVDAFVGSLRELVERADSVAAIGIDIPIGHVAGGVRKADTEARAAVGPRASSVFAAPPAHVLRAASYTEANRTLSARGLPMMSRQAWALVPKMLEAAEVAASDERVVEVHPEVSFCELAGEHLQWSKKTWNGLAHRRRLLADNGISLPDELAEAGRVPPDDVVDAAAVAWTARRVARREARTLPEVPEEHEGRQVAIWV